MAVRSTVREAPPPGARHGIASHAYTDGAIYAREMDAIFAIQSHPGCVLNVRKWIPHAVDWTHVYVDWFFPGAELSAEDRAMVEGHAAGVFAEDIPLIESVQQGLTSRAYKSGPLMLDTDGTELSEHAVADIQRLWCAAMGETG